MLNYLYTVGLWGLNIVEELVPDRFLPDRFVAWLDDLNAAWPARNPANCSRCYYGSRCYIHKGEL